MGRPRSVRRPRSYGPGYSGTRTYTRVSQRDCEAVGCSCSSHLSVSDTPWIASRSFRNVIFNRDQDDLDVFQRQLPNEIKSPNQLRLERTNLSHSHAFRFATAPLRLANACRLVHSAVTGPKARAASKIDGKRLEAAWEALQRSWEEFESLRSITRAGIVGAEEKIRFVDGWQVRLFSLIVIFID